MKSKKVSPSNFDQYVVFFLIEGFAGFVLPRYENAVYITVKAGEYFGLIDIVFGLKELDQS